MSDEIAQVVEQDVAKPMLDSIEQIGETVPQHFGEIGQKLEETATSHLENEAGIVGQIEAVGKDDAGGALSSAEADAGHLGSDVPGGGSPPGSGSVGSGGEPLGSGDPVAQAQAPGSQGASDDPVDVVSGEMFLPQRDVMLPGLLPVVLERMHRSGYRMGRWFGVSWASTLDQRVEVDDDGIHYAAPDGVVLHYPVPLQPGQRVSPSEGARWPLSWDRPSDTIRIELPETGRTLHFPPGPTPELARPLAAVSDRNGHRISFVHDDDGVPTDVYHSGGYHVRVESGLVAGAPRILALRLADPAGGADLDIASFGYDALGRLVETVSEFPAEGSGPPLVFEYDDADRITGWTDRNGHRYGYEFDASGRVVRADGSGGFLAASFAYDDEAGTTTLTDSLGHATVYHRNERGQVVRVVDPLGGETLTERDRYGRLLSATDPLGRTSRFTLDGRGDPVRIDQPDGTSVLIEYAAPNQPARVTRPGGGVWQYAYDERGNLTSRVEPDGATVGYSYDEQGRLRTVVDALGNTTRCETDRAGMPLASLDPTGAAVRIQRDAFGRPVALTDPAGGVTRLGWTARDRLAWRTGPDGTTTRWTYDPEGNLLRTADPAAGETRFEYGPFDRITARIEPTGARYDFGYDTELRLTTVASPAGPVWSYEYDPCDNLTGERDFNGRRVDYRVDAAGQLVERVNAAGQSVSFSRDEHGRVLERRHRDPRGEGEERGTDAGTLSFSYDAAGRLVRALTADSVLSFTHDAAGRVLTESIDGRTLTNAYDAAGRRIQRVSPGGVVSQWTYDAAGRPAALTNTGGGLSFEYDEAGRETSRFLGEHAALTQTFDELGRVTGQGIWAYDGTGESGGAGDGEPPVGGYRPLQQRGYRYGAGNAPVEVTDQLRGDRSYEFDPIGRVTSVSAAGWTERYAYDALGNVTDAAFSGAAQRSDEPGEPQEAADRAYAGTLIRRSGRTVYEHDAAGRVTRVSRRTLSGQSRAWAYTWDADDRLLQVVTPHGAVWRYSYDALGRRIAKRRVGADAAVLEEVLFSYEGTRLAEQVARGPAEAETSTLTWDWMPSTVRPVAQVERSWAADAPQERIDTEFYAIVTDLVGTPSELVSGDGGIAWYQTTSLWGDPIAAPGGSTDCPLRFPGQYHDPETGWNYNYNRYYDPRAAGYASPDPLGLEPGPNDHGYVQNPLVTADPLGLSPYPTGPKPPYEWAPNPAPTGVLEPGEAWDPSKGTPVIGRLPDTKIAGSWPGYNKLVARDPSVGGTGWSLAKNDAWMQTIIDQRGSVYTVSSLKDNFWNVDRMEPTVYAREVQQLLGAGYTWNGDYLIPPAP